MGVRDELCGWYLWVDRLQIWVRVSSGMAEWARKHLGRGYVRPA